MDGTDHLGQPVSEPAVSAPAQEKRYRLMVREGWGLVGDVGDNTVALDDDRLSYPVRGRWGWRGLGDIDTVTLQTNYVPRVGTIAQCIIGVRNGRIVRIHSGDAGGRPDPAKAAAYRAFVEDFHRRLVDGGFALHIGFRTGFSRLRYGILISAIVAAIGLFVVLPIVLAVIAGEPGILYAPIFGLALAWPAWQIARRNAPGTYHPTRPPDLLEAGDVRPLV
jgi:hypothetical protein